MSLNGWEKPAVGMGFRKEVYGEILEHVDEIEVLEITVDHYIYGGSSIREIILDIARRVPVVAHGVGLSIGTAVEPDRYYLDMVADFIERVSAPWYSEHLAYTKVPGLDVAQLLPLPRTRAMADVVAENLSVVRRHVNVPLALENITYYFEYPGAEYSEPEFLNLISEESDAFLLLDLENLHINSCNHGFDPYEYLRALRAGVVRSVHLAGGGRQAGMMIDSHDRSVPAEALDILSVLLSHERPDSIIVERDQEFGSFDEILTDIRRAKQIRG